MKPSLHAITTLVLLTGSLAFVQVGCSSTATRQSTGEYIDDATITTKVKAKFVKDDTVKALQVNVETFKGVVQLSGFVDNGIQKARAEQIARGTSGVIDVKNNITVKTDR